MPKNPHPRRKKAVGPRVSQGTELTVFTAASIFRTTITKIRLEAIQVLDLEKVPLVSQNARRTPLFPFWMRNGGGYGRSSGQMERR